MYGSNPGAYRGSKCNWTARPKSPANFQSAFNSGFPNGGKRSIGLAVKLKREGVKSGVPDLCLPVARKGFTGLWVEMKKPGGTTSPAQAHWLAALAMHGHKTALCTSMESARDVLLDYLTSEAA